MEPEKKTKGKILAKTKDAQLTHRGKRDLICISNLVPLFFYSMGGGDKKKGGCRDPPLPPPPPKPSPLVSNPPLSLSLSQAKREIMSLVSEEGG